MRLFYKILLNLTLVVCFVVLFFTLHEKSENNFKNNLVNYHIKQIKSNNESDSHFVYVRNSTAGLNFKYYNIWCIFCRATNKSPLKNKFTVFSHSLVNHSSVPLNINVITDETSRQVADEVLNQVKNSTNKNFKVSTNHSSSHNNYNYYLNH